MGVTDYFSVNYSKGRDRIVAENTVIVSRCNLETSTQTRDE
jgi:hypothetical protein